MNKKKSYRILRGWSYYKRLENNSITFDNLLSQLKLYNEKYNYFTGFQEFINEIRFNLDYDSFICVNFYELVLEIGILEDGILVLDISKHLHVIESYKDVINIVENDLTLVEYSRIKKIKKLRNHG